MLSHGELEYLKENYYGHKLLYVRFSDEEFVFRSLSLKDYEIILRLYNDKFKQETGICNLAVVYPEEYEFQECPYGYLPTIVSEYILKISDLLDNKDIENLYNITKNNYNLFLNCLDLIKAFINDYTYEEMEEWTWQQVINMVVRAEAVARFKGFDYRIDFTAVNNEPIPKDEIVKNILENRGNPIIYFKEDIMNDIDEDKNMIKQPFIVGQNWNNKEVLDGFRKTKIKKRWKIQ